MINNCLFCKTAPLNFLDHKRLPSPTTNAVNVPRLMSSDEIIIHHGDENDLDDVINDVMNDLDEDVDPQAHVTAHNR